MKRLLLILLFVPFISIGQIKTLEELKRITSKETFERVCIENGYEKSPIQMVNNILTYVLNPEFNYKNEVIFADGVAYYYTSGELMNEFGINLLNNDDNKNYYNNIFDKAKSNCDFVDIVESKAGRVYSTYDCMPNGKLGFAKGGAYFINYSPKKKHHN